MKKLIPIGILILAMIPFQAITQEYKSFQVENIAAEAVWPAVFKTFQELKLPRPMVNKNTGTGETSYYYFTALMIKNRARFRMEYADGSLTIRIFGRQYMTEKGWADNMMPMSKKQASNILDPLKDRIIELTKNNPFSAPAQVAQAKQETGKVTGNEIKKAGIYEDFVIVRTDDPDMDLLALRTNGNIIGYDLWDDKEMVKTLVFKENKDSEAVTLEFNENGLPTYMGIENLIIKIESNTSGELNLSMKDIDGNFIGNEKTSIPSLPFQHPTDVFFEKNKSHGPCYYTESLESDLNLSDWLGYAGYALSGIAAGIQGPKEILKAIIKESANDIGITLADPNNKFCLNELNTAVGLIGLEGTIAASTASLAAVAPALAPLVPVLAAAAVTAAGLKMSYDAFIRI